MKKFAAPIVIVLLLIAEGLGCSWSRLDGIRYNGVRRIDDFAYIPRPKDEKYFLSRRTFYEGDRFSYNENVYGEPEEEPAKPTAKPEQPAVHMAKGRELEAKGKYVEAAEEYRKGYLAGELLEHVYEINGILDRLDLFSSDAATTPVALKEYLEIRDSFDRSRSLNKPEESSSYYEARTINPSFCADEERRLRKLMLNAQAAPLKDNAYYLIAAIKYGRNDFEGAIKDLLKFPTLYPKSEKLAAAHFLAGKCYYTQYAPLTAFSYEVQDGVVKGVLDRLKLAAAQFDKAIAADPKGLLLPEYYGWKGGAHWRADQPLASLEAFTKAFLNEQRQPDRWLNEMPFPYSIIRAEQEAKALEIVSVDARLLLSYVWYGIYHHPDTPERQALLAKAAKAFLEQNPKTELASSLALRLAQTLYGAKDYAGAVAVAERMMGDKVFADQALWMRAVSNAKLNRLEAAEADLRRLIKDYPQSQLVRGSREELAIVLERAGRPGDAVEVYFESGNIADARYTMDIIMTVEQVAELAKRINAKYRDEVYYALGSKYMLDLKLNEAREAFSKVTAKPAVPVEGQAHDVGTEKERILEVIADLEKLQQAEKNAVTDEEKASALYNIGAYLYRKNNHNSGRHAILNNVMIQSYDSPVFATNSILPNEQELKEKRFDRANLLLRAEEYFRRVAFDLPKTTAAPKALYSAALTRLWLTNYHSYYLLRNNYDDAAEIAKAREYLTQLRRRYPKHPLAAEAAKVIAELQKAR